MVLDCGDRLERHGVHGVALHQGVDVHGVGVIRVLGAGARPERPLQARSGGCEGGPAIASERVEEVPVGHPSVCHCRLAPQLERFGGPDLLQPWVDLGVEPGYEERGDRYDPIEASTATAVVVEPGEVGLHDLPIAVEREDECDVDRDALADQPANGRHSRRCRRDLDIQVGAIRPSSPNRAPRRWSPRCRLPRPARPPRRRTRRLHRSVPRPVATHRSQPGYQPSSGRSRSRPCPRPDPPTRPTGRRSRRSR